MVNYIQENDSMQVIAPVGGVDGGQLYKQGSLIGVVVSSVDEGEQFTLMLEGAFDNVPKKTGESWNVGDMLYYEVATSSLTTTATSNTWAGYAFYTAASGATTGAILLKM
jgi:predicted RecA/RadA family phage recombinase